MENELYQFYMKNSDYRDYIDKCVKTYGKDVQYMLETPIAKEVYREMQEGGVNAVRKKY